MDITAFRAAFPEFASIVKYPDAQITFWSTMGEALLNESRWGDLYDYGLQLLVAHNITLAALNAAAGTKGKTPGQQSGIVSSKGLGGVSVGYDTGSVSMQGAGDYNLTSYGRQYWQLMNVVGMGGSYV
jgi:hypothetical protein